MITTAGIVYALLAALAAGVQFALAAGAPWGHLTLGGQYPGRLPPSVRLGTLLQSAILLAMATVMAGTAGIIGYVPPRWAVWASLAVTLLSMIGNLVTPSVPERRLWGPVTVLMFVSALVITFAPTEG